ncbi:MAG: polysaccharide biosynthesis/export family protein [Flavobacteriales bacterium]
MNKRIKTVLFVFGILIFASCVSKKDIIYFQNDAIDQENVSNSYITIIKPDDLLIDKLSPDYIKEPNVNIKIANYKISVMGDVQRPGSYNVPNERITILDALALAGDLNISAQRNNILIIREEGNKKVQYQVDLRSNKLLTSPVYYLQQNDVVYVEPNYARIQSASSNSNTSLFISITGLIITIASLLTR